MPISATATEKALVRQTLGYLGTNYTYTTLVFSHRVDKSDHTTLERSLDDIADAETYLLFQGYLAEITDLESKIKVARSTSVAVDSIGKGDVVLNRKQIPMLWAEHYLIAQRLAKMLYVSIRYHPYTTAIAGTEIKA